MHAPTSRERLRPPRWAAVIGVLLVLLALVSLVSACAMGTGAAATVADEPAQEPPPAQPGKGGQLDSGGGAGSGGGSVPFGDLAERKIVRTGEVTLEVPTVGTAVGQLRALALSLDGYVSDSRTGTDHDAATVTLRIPAERFDEALQRLHAMDGEVKAEATRDEDVTSSIVDLEARIRNLQASEEQYRVLLGRAGQIKDILAVQTRLDDVRGQIEQLGAQLKQLNSLATLSTLTVTLVPPSTPVQDATDAWDPGATFGNAVAALVSAGQSLADFGIWLLIVGLPILVAVGIIVWLAHRLLPLTRRISRTAPAPAAEE